MNWELCGKMSDLRRSAMAWSLAATADDHTRLEAKIGGQTKTLNAINGSEQGRGGQVSYHAGMRLLLRFVLREHGQKINRMCTDGPL